MHAVVGADSPSTSRAWSGEDEAATGEALHARYEPFTDEICDISSGDDDAFVVAPSRLEEEAPEAGAVSEIDASPGRPEPRTKAMVDRSGVRPSDIPFKRKAATPLEGSREAVLLLPPPSPRAAMPPPAPSSPRSPVAPAPSCEGPTEASVGASAATGGSAASPPLGGTTEVPTGASAAAGGDEHPHNSSAAGEAGVDGGGATPSPQAQPGAGFSGPATAAGPSSSQEMVLRSWDWST